MTTAPDPGGPPPLGFAAAWSRIDDVPGWLTRDQAAVLWAAVAGRAGLGDEVGVVEIGSHQGRSTAVLASASPRARVLAVDPFVRTRRYAGPEVETLLRRHLAQLGVAGRVTVLARPSAEALRDFSGPVDVLYVDGKHDAASLVRDLRWARHVVPGGIVLVHDAYSSVGVTAGLLVAVLPGRALAYRDRTGSLVRLEARPPTLRERAALLAPLPWFARNVVVKVLLRLRARGVARRLGHEGPDDPF